MTFLPVNVPVQTVFACRLWPTSLIIVQCFSGWVPRIADESSDVLYVIIIIFVATCFCNNVQL